MLLVVVLAAGVFIGSAVSQWKPLPEQPRPAQQLPSPTIRQMGRIRVEVLNAGGEPGMARVATEQLRDLGFDVVYFGNAESFGRDSTVVLDRSGELEAARAVGEALGSRSVLSEPDTNLYLDVTVLLGREWEPAIPERESAPEEEVPWWDLRQYLP